MKKVVDSARCQSEYVEKLTEIWLKTCKPFFQLAPRSNSYIHIKGVPGRIKKLETGIPNKVTRVSARTFYDTIMPEMNYIMETFMERTIEDLEQVRKTLQSDKYERCDDPSDDNYNKKINTYTINTSFNTEKGI